MEASSLDPSAIIMAEDLLDFTLDACEEGYHYDGNTLKAPSSSTTSTSQDPDDSNPEHAEEELEWLSNKDAFPSVETYFNILSPNPSITSNQRSPVSVLDPATTTTSTTSSSTTSFCDGANRSSILALAHYPAKPRSKRRMPRRPSVTASCFPKFQRAFADVANQQYWGCRQVNTKTPAVGRRCQHCGTVSTPQWRASPMGPKTLCNACGVRYKSGEARARAPPSEQPDVFKVVAIEFTPEGGGDKEAEADVMK